MLVEKSTAKSLVRRLALALFVPVKALESAQKIDHGRASRRAGPLPRVLPHPHALSPPRQRVPEEELGELSIAGRESSKFSDFQPAESPLARNLDQ